jgi:hypothetical protein
MSDTDTTDRTARQTDPGLTSGWTVRDYLEHAALAVLVVFAVVSAFQFYVRATAAISAFVSEAYRPLFKALFNLAVVLLSGAGAALLLERRIEA